LELDVSEARLAADNGSADVPRKTKVNSHFIGKTTILAPKVTYLTLGEGHGSDVASGELCVILII
jgi:hypothetical protein